MRLWVAIVILVASYGRAFADDGARDLCRDVLIYAAHNINQSLRSSSMASDAKTALCNTEESIDSSKKSGGGTFIVFGAFGLSGKGGAEKLKQMRKQYCSSNDSSFSKDQLEDVLSNIVDKDSVQAWKDCVDRKNGGLVGSVEREDEVIVFHLKWIGLAGVDNTVVEGFQLFGADCEKKWEEGTLLNSVDRLILCKGKTDKAVRLVIQAHNGSIELKSPAVPQTEAPIDAPVKKISVLQKCYEG